MSSLVKQLEKVFPSGPSWPFRTESARLVWAESERLLEKDPKAQLSAVLQQATWNTKVPAYELTADDYSLLVMALRWKAMTLGLKAA